MPYPPAFDRAWDETFPPDTQLANLLGQDIRNFKTDIRERLGLLSGTFANRPSNMDAVYGGSGYGILYFSTDTSQIFQWNGAAWVDVSASISPLKLVNNTVVNFTLPTVAADAQTISIPANTLQVGSVVDVVARVKIYSGSSNPSNNVCSVYFGATRIAAATFSAFSGTFATTEFVHFFGTVHVVGASSQRQVATTNNDAVIQASGPFPTNLDPTEAISGAIVVKTRLDQAQNNMTMDFDMLSIRIFR